MPIARLATVPMWYDERGDGDPLVLLHPGGAGIDSRALTASLEALSRLFRTYLCHLIITDFLTKDPVPTFAPIHRAQHQ